MTSKNILATLLVTLTIYFNFIGQENEAKKTKL